MINDGRMVGWLGRKLVVVVVVVRWHVKRTSSSSCLRQRCGDRGREKRVFQARTHCCCPCYCYSVNYYLPFRSNQLTRCSRNVLLSQLASSCQLIDDCCASSSSIKAPPEVRRSIILPTGIKPQVSARPGIDRLRPCSGRYCPSMSFRTSFKRGGPLIC
jgi:hypothetical protein